VNAAAWLNDGEIMLIIRFIETYLSAALANHSLLCQLIIGVYNALIQL